MAIFRSFLVISTVIIFVITFYVIMGEGRNWPEVFFGDLIALNWRSQFNADFLIHLLLLASWVVWREGFTIKGFVFGFLCIFLGGMFGFPYLLYATFQAEGDVKKMLLGVNGR